MTGLSAAAPWTIGKILSWAAEDFRGKGFDSPRLDAELLLCQTLGCDRVRLIMDAHKPLAQDELQAFRELIQRRRRAEPIAYILGFREFYGLRFRVSPSVLVPRPDTETLVTTALRRTAHRDLFGAALDLCTGSGCVAVAFAKQRPTWLVYGGDISSDAVAVARDNAHRLGAIFNVCFRKSDLLSAFNKQRFSLITANPPYIPSSDIPQLQADVRDFEPRLALDGGADGLDFVHRLLKAAPAQLAPGGVLAIEIGHDQAPRVAALFARAGFTAVERSKDYGGIERVVSGVLNS